METFLSMIELRRAAQDYNFKGRVYAKAHDPTYEVRVLASCTKVEVLPVVASTPQGKATLFEPYYFSFSTEDIS